MSQSDLFQVFLPTVKKSQQVTSSVINLDQPVGGNWAPQTVQTTLAADTENLAVQPQKETLQEQNVRIGRPEDVHLVRHQQEVASNGHDLRNSSSLGVADKSESFEAWPIQSKSLLDDCETADNIGALPPQQHPNLEVQNNTERQIPAHPGTKVETQFEMGHRYFEI